jgi:hypothetical protein
MSGQKQAAEKLLEQKNRRKPETTPAVEHGQNSLGLMDVPFELIHASQDTQDSQQDALLNSRNLQEAQKIALALKINRVQGNNHLQRVISLKRRTEENEDENEETRAGIGNETLPELERGGNGHNKETALEAPVRETRIKPGGNGNGSRSGEASEVEGESAGNERTRTEAREGRGKLQAPDREGHTIEAAKTREAEPIVSERGEAEVSESPERGAGAVVKGEAVSEPGEKTGKLPTQTGVKEAAPVPGSTEAAKSAIPEEATKRASEAPEQALSGSGGTAEALGAGWQAAGGKEAAETIPAPVFETTMAFSSGGGAKADLLGEFATHTAYQKLKVSDAIKAQQEQLVIEGNANKSKFLAEMGVKLSAAYAVCNTQKEELEQQRKIQKNKIEDEQKARKQEIEQGYHPQFIALLLAYTNRKAEMIKNGDTRAASVRAFAQKSKEKIASSTMEKYSRAIALGEEKAKFYAPQKRGPEIGDVARKIASNMAGKIIQSGRDAINLVVKDGNDKANEISEMASKAASKFSDGMVKSITGLINIRDKAMGEVDKVADLLIKKVDPIIDNSIAAINGIKIPLLANMTKVAAGFPVKVDLAVIKGKQALAFAGQQRIDDIQDGFMAAYNKIHGTRGLKGRRLRSLITRLTLMMTSSREESVGEIERGTAVLKANQGKGLIESIGKLGEMIGRLQLELTNAFLAVTKGFNTMLQDAGMAKISSLAISTMASVVANYDAKLVEATGKANSELDKAVARCQDGINKKEIDTQNSQANMLLELNQKIDKKAHDMQLSWIVRGLLGLGGFLYGLGKSVLKILAIMLGVVIALAILAAAIGAIVGLVFVLLYSLVGAALAGMIALIVGLVLAAAVGLAAFAAMAYGIYTLGKTVWQNIVAIFTDDSLTAFERGSMAGETTGDVAMTVLPFIPKVRTGTGNLLSRIGTKLRIPFLKGLAPKVEAGAPAEAASVLPGKPSPYAPTGRMTAVRPEEGLPAPAEVVRGRPSPYATTEKMPAVRPEELPAPAEVVPAKPSPLPPTEPMPAVPAKPSPALGKTEPPLGPSEPAPAVRSGGPGEIPAPLRGEPTLPPIKPRPPLRQPYAVVPRSPIAKRMNDIALIKRLREDFYRTPGKVVLELHKIDMHQRWRALGQEGEPPAAFISSKGYLYVDINKVGELNLSRWAALNRIRAAAEAKGAGAPVEPSAEMSPGLGKTQPPLATTKPPLGITEPPPGSTTIREPKTLPGVGPAQKPPSPAGPSPAPRGGRRSGEPPKPEGRTLKPTSELSASAPVAQKFTNVVDAQMYRDHWLFYKPNRLLEVFSRKELLDTWRLVLKQKGNPPSAFVTSEGWLYVDLNRVGQLSPSRYAEIKFAGQRARGEIK